MSRSPSSPQTRLQHRLQAIKKSALLRPHAASAADRARQRDKALARWDGEGGAGPDGPQEGWSPRTPTPATGAHT